MTARKRPTIDDVARLAGVSRSAVSRTFTPGAYASKATSARVREAAEAIGYRPNLLARSLSISRSTLVGVAITRLENSFHADLLQALTAGVQQLGYRVLLFVTDPLIDADPPIDDVLRHQVDAIVLCAMRLSSDFAQECQAAGVPVVMLNRTSDAPGIPAVVGDNRAGGRVVASFLVAAGHRRPAFIAGFDDSSTSGERERGFTSCLADSGLPAPLRDVGRFDSKQAAAATRRLLSRPDPPDALFCANDHMALAAVDVARREFAIDVGRQLSIVGFDDSRPAAAIGLTTFSQDAASLATEATQILADLVSAQPRAAAHTIVPGELVVRDTARLPTRGLVEAGGRRVWRSS